MQDIVSERAFYDALFAKDPSNEHITEGYEALYDHAFRQRPAGRVLDLGCGTGAHAIRLAGGRGFDVVAVDLTFGGVQSARNRFREAGLEGQFVVADAEHLPFRDGAFAVSWTSLLLHHFPRLDRLPRELARVTRERVVAFEPNAQNPLSWFAFNVVNQVWGLSSTTKNQRALFPGRLARVFRRHGLRMSRPHYVHRGWRDGDRSIALVRRTYEALTSWLPMRFRANKFLVSFEKTTS